MSKEKLIKQNKYAEELKNKLSAPTPAKHVGNPESYKLFLQRELAAATKKIDSLKLTEPSKK